MSKPSFTVDQAIMAEWWLHQAARSAIAANYGKEKSFHLTECDRKFREAAKILGFRLEPIDASKQEAA